MKRIKDLVKKYDLKLLRYSERLNTRIIDTDKGKFILKKNRKLDKRKRFDYLSSRSFDYYLDPINDLNDEYEIYPFIEEVDVSSDQRAVDIIYLISLLHNKTTTYSDVDLDSIKELYEEIVNEIDYLYKYYYDLQDIIEQEVYMAPNTYYLIINISYIYACLDFCKKSIDKWYNIVSKKKKSRLVVLHNNLDLTHIIETKDNRYLISWDKSIKGNPIYDFYHFYNNNYKDIDFISLFKVYNNKYPLLEEEKLLLFVLISLPEKVYIDDDILKSCKDFYNLIDKINKTSDLVSDNRPSKTEEK